MNNIFFSSILVLLGINLFFYLSANIHTFQLNHYKYDAQIRWIARNIIKIILQSILYIILAFGLVLEKYIYIHLAISLVLLVIFGIFMLACYLMEEVFYY
jgi:hypothetical protein